MTEASPIQTIAVSGTSGLVGARLVHALCDAGHGVRRLVRSRATTAADDVYWNPADGVIDREKLSGCQAVVHLAGTSIAGRWTDVRKREIRESRVKGTDLLARTIAGLPDRPAVLISASAVGYYGDRADEWLTEASAPGNGFLAEVAREWESATQPAIDAGIRTVQLRLGVVLSRAGGAIRQMLTPFRLGLGGVVGSGDQYLSWIALTDVVRLIQWLLAATDISGPVNAVAPEPVTNRVFTKTLGAVLGRPTFVPLPAVAVGALLGEMGRATLLASSRVKPARLLQTSFEFAYPRLESALRHALAEPD